MKLDDPYQRVSQPLLIVISGPSGVGKDTIARLLMAARDSFHFVVTATTRRARVGEVHGRDYIFVSQDEFARMIDEGELLEYAVVYDDFKGVPRQQIRDAMASGRDVIMRVDVQGAATIRRLVPDAVFIFLLAESEAAMVRRLKERRSESDDSLKLRIATARQEMHRLGEFDYWVINADGRQEGTVEQILCIVDAEHQRINRKPITI